jgi:hypothetical protein
MKTNFTLNLKKAILTATIILISFSAFSLNDIKATTNAGGLTVSIINNAVVMNWSNTTASYYEIQASADGKTFTTIGMVIGADPKGDGTTFSFKQQVAKLKPGKPYYRVVLVNTDNTATATQAVKATN